MRFSAKQIWLPVAILTLGLCSQVVFAEDTKKDETKTVAAAKSDKPKHKDPDLIVGDRAPALTISEWLQGDEVKEFEKGKIYVVEFWATWCGPCIDAIPHLNKLQEKYKDKSVIFIGVDYETELDKVKEFLEAEKPKMEYRVAYDDLSGDNVGKMFENWLTAAEQGFIPTAFVVNREGRIAWIGHSALLEKPLAKIVDGKWDIEKARDDFLTVVRRRHAMEDLYAEMSKAYKKKDVDRAIEVIEEMVKVDPAQKRSATNKKFFAYFELNQREKAYAMEEQLLTDYKKDHNTLSSIAQAIAETKGLEESGYKMALKLAKRANEIAKEKQPGPLYALAAISFSQGDLDRAIDYQTKAIEHINPKMKGEIKHQNNILKKYQNEKVKAKKNAGEESKDDAQNKPADGKG